MPEKINDDNAFSMFDLPQDNQPEPPKPAAQPDTTTEPGKVVLSQEQFDAMLKAQEEGRRQHQELLATIFQGTRQQPQTQTPQTPIEIDLNGLPDPRDDIEGYHKGLAERLGKTVQDIRTSTVADLTSVNQQAAQQDQLLNTAWDVMGNRHKEISAYPELVEIAATQVFGELRQKGIEPMVMLSRNMDQLVDDVAARTNTMLSRYRGGEGGGEDDAGRAQVLSGAGPKPRGKRQAEPAKPNDFVDSMKKMQHELRIY